MSDLIKKATLSRGLLLNEFTTLEKSIELYIARYFLGYDNPKIWEMFELVLDRITFENKRTCLRAMLEKVDVNNGHVKTNTKGYPSNKLCNEIRRLNDYRNYFAHYMLVDDKKLYIENNALIGLYELRDKTNIKWFTQNEFSQIIADIKNSAYEIFRYLNPT